MGWILVDWLLIEALTAAVHKYEVSYPGISHMASPLHDEGFRVKRYDPDVGIHNWHGDVSTTDRAIATFFYLNDVPSGGETLFHTPRQRAVKPKKGTVLLFPPSPMHLHAGAPPRSGPKYAISNYVTRSAPEKARKPLDRRSVDRLRAEVGVPPHEWTRSRGSRV